jgi:hypothetical protein
MVRRDEQVNRLAIDAIHRAFVVGVDDADCPLVFDFGRATGAPFRETIAVPETTRKVARRTSDSGHLSVNDTPLSRASRIRGED